MGGYGGASGKDRRKKDGCYYDSQKQKVTEISSIIAAEYYISFGIYVVFLHKSEIEKEGRPDLLVDYKLLVEVKGVVSLNPSQISKQINHASKQISDELARRSEEEQLPGKIVLISSHETFEIGFRLINAGYQEAKRKNQVHFQVEFWFRGEFGMEIRVLK